MKKLTLEEVKKIIPHRDPMLLVDEVLELEPGKKIITKFYVSPERDIFEGHFPGSPVLPGVYTVECMAQASDILLLTLDRYKGTIPYFIGIDKVKFMSMIEPGDTITIHAKILTERIEKAIATCSAEVYNGDVLAASGEVTLAMR
ncbi:MAG: 3-hydroxyacyl-ACP dehydratase FabZ [Clostridiales bacterium]|jgi:3-hydroxyacyl-[acyl-carrier-protein] dehydratase|nr:3-hydroxyacyl-ACP dehydratase FabZ [Clostridiales bacterium]